MNNFKKNIFKTVIKEDILYSYSMYDGSNQPGENATCTAYNDIGGVTILYSMSNTLALDIIYYISYGGGPLELYNGNGLVHYFPNENKLVTINSLGSVTLISNCSALLPTTSYCYDGFWELNDPAHPGGGSVTYTDTYGETVVINNIWSGFPVNFNSSSTPDAIGAAPCL